MTEKTYIAVDVWGWAEDKDFLKAIAKREKDSGTDKTFMNVFEIDASIKTYSFAWYVPQIVGAKLIMKRETHVDEDKKWTFTYEFPNYILTEEDMEKKS